MAINNQMVEWCGLYHFANLASWRHFPYFHRDFFCRSKYQAIDGGLHTFEKKSSAQPCRLVMHLWLWSKKQILLEPVIKTQTSRSQKHWTIKTVAPSLCLLILGYILICRVAAKWYFHVFSYLAKVNHTFHHYPKKSAFPTTNGLLVVNLEGRPMFETPWGFSGPCPHDISQWKRKLCGKRMQDGAPKIAKLPCKWLNYGLW